MRVALQRLTGDGIPNPNSDVGVFFRQRLKGRRLLHYHFSESGLDNVFLRNGFMLEKHESYGDLVSFQDSNGLHDRLDRVLVEKAPYLTGAAMRVLRSDLFEQTPEEFAVAMGSTETAIRAQESDHDSRLDGLLELTLRQYIRDHKQIGGGGPSCADGEIDDRPFFIVLGIENDEWVGEITYNPPVQVAG